ncbi:uncharacterized protein [Amphiura filiformis]|uniref:uncharacterized protein n=1 Tax=Amphiura filiformis TaxID=82378 RepID=UPI003B21815B
MDASSSKSDLMARIIYVCFFLSVLQIQVCGSCEPNWVVNDGYCYFISTGSSRTGLSFHAAQRACQSMGAELTSIHSEAENDFIYQLMETRGKRIVWTGLHDTSREGSFEWTDGTPLDYSNWKSGEPNDSGFGEDCVDMSSYAVVNGQSWNDNNCSVSYPYTCKRGGTVCPEDIETVTEFGTTGVVVTWNEPQTTELSGPIQTMRSHEPGTGFPIGVTSVLYTFMDASNNEVTCSFSITVETVDTTQPNITRCPESFESVGGRHVTWNEPMAVDVSGVTHQSRSHPPGMFLITTTDVEYTFTDSSNNSATCRFSINIIEDTVPPVIEKCPSDIHVLHEFGQSPLPVQWTKPSASDNYGRVMLVDFTHTPGQTFPDGSTQVIYMFADDSYNVATCKFSVVVKTDKSQGSSGSSQQFTAQRGNEDRGFRIAIAALVLGVFVALCLIVLIVIYIRQNRRSNDMRLNLLTKNAQDDGDIGL